MTLTSKTTIDRVLAIAILLVVISFGLIVVSVTNLAAEVEFSAGVRSRYLEAQGGHSSRPAIAETYRQVYRYDWAWLPIALLWAGWIIRKRECSLLAIICHVGVSLNLAVFWMLLTLFALYLQNQNFYT